MALNAQSGTSGNEANIECKIKGSAKENWNCCQLLQFCAKVAALNSIAQEGKLKDIRGTKKYKKNRTAGNTAANDFREAWNSDSKKRKNPTKSRFYHECAVKKSKIGAEMEPDHVHEIQRGGDPGASNLKWLDESVNASIQGHVAGLPKNPSYVKADCCPAGKKNCKGKGPRAKVTT